MNLSCKTVYLKFALFLKKDHSCRNLHSNIDTLFDMLLSGVGDHYGLESRNLPLVYSNIGFSCTLLGSTRLGLTLSGPVVLILPAGQRATSGSEEGQCMVAA